MYWFLCRDEDIERRPLTGGGSANYAQLIELFLVCYGHCGECGFVKYNQFNILLKCAFLLPTIKLPMLCRYKNSNKSYKPKDAGYNKSYCGL